MVYSPKCLQPLGTHTLRADEHLRILLSKFRGAMQACTISLKGHSSQQIYTQTFAAVRDWYPSLRQNTW